MGNVLAWIAAIGGVLATIGAWAGPLRARWNRLHQWRYAEVWEWQRNQPEGSARADAARWFGEWTGSVGPRRGGEPGPQTPGLHSADLDDAYKRYIDFLSGMHDAGRLMPPTPPIAEGDHPPELPAPDYPDIATGE